MFSGLFPVISLSLGFSSFTIMQVGVVFFMFISFVQWAFCLCKSVFHQIWEISRRYFLKYSGHFFLPSWYSTYTCVGSLPTVPQISWSPVHFRGTCSVHSIHVWGIQSIKKSMKCTFLFYLCLRFCWIPWKIPTSMCSLAVSKGFGQNLYSDLGHTPSVILLLPAFFPLNLLCPFSPEPWSQYLELTRCRFSAVVFL